MAAREMPPGSRTLALIDGFRYARAPLDYIRSYHRRHGPVASGRFPGIGPMVYVADPDMETWPVNEAFALRSRTQRITLEVILRAVFGMRDEGRFRRAQVLIGEFAGRAHPVTLFAFMRRDLGRWSPWARFKRARAA